MNTEILALRTEIDNLDKEILQLLEERFQLAEEIGEIKRSEGMKIQDKEREEQLLNNLTKQTTLDEKFITQLFSVILKESKRIQSKNEP